MRWLALVALTGCSSASDARSTEDKVAIRAPPPERRDTTTIELPGEGSGVVWDATATALFVTDSTHAAIVKWTLPAGFASVTTLPPAQHDLGGLVRLPDGRFVVTSFGFGRDGAVFVVDGDKAREVPELDRKRRRIALAAAPDGTLYVTYFVVMPGSRRQGGVARLDPAKGETDVVTDLEKPVGIAATADTLFIADQETSAIIAVAIADPTKRKTLADKLPGVDHIALLPSGDLVTGGKRGVISRVTQAGVVTVVADGFGNVRGVSYDAAGKRLFVVERSASSNHHKLHIFPLI